MKKVFLMGLLALVSQASFAASSFCTIALRPAAFGGYSISNIACRGPQSLVDKNPLKYDTMEMAITQIIYNSATYNWKLISNTGAHGYHYLSFEFSEGSAPTQN